FEKLSLAKSDGVQFSACLHKTFSKLNWPFVVARQTPTVDPKRRAHVEEAAWNEKKHGGYPIPPGLCGPREGWCVRSKGTIRQPNLVWRCRPCGRGSEAPDRRASQVPGCNAGRWHRWRPSKGRRAAGIAVRDSVPLPGILRPPHQRLRQRKRCRRSRVGAQVRPPFGVVPCSGPVRGATANAR